jgi:hypothetical protein
VLACRSDCKLLHTPACESACRLIPDNCTLPGGRFNACRQCCNHDTEIVRGRTVAQVARGSRGAEVTAECFHPASMAALAAAKAVGNPAAHKPVYPARFLACILDAASAQMPSQAGGTTALPPLATTWCSCLHSRGQKAPLHRQQATTCRFRQTMKWRKWLCVQSIKNSVGQQRGKACSAGAAGGLQAAGGQAAAVAAGACAVPARPPHASRRHKRA